MYFLFNEGHTFVVRYLDVYCIRGEPPENAEKTLKQETKHLATQLDTCHTWRAEHSPTQTTLVEASALTIESSWLALEQANYISQAKRELAREGHRDLTRSHTLVVHSTREIKGLS